MRTSRRPRLLAIGVVPLALLLSGCFGLPGIPNLPGGSGDTGDQTVEDFIEGATGGDIDIELDAVPEGFPTEAVPLVEGDVVAGFAVPASDGKTAWQVTIAATDEATAEGAGALLEAAGLAHNGFTYESAEYLVVIATQAVDGVHHVGYTVTER